MGAAAASPARPPDLGGFRSGRRGSFFQPRPHAAPLAAGLRGSGRRSDLAGALAAGSRSPLAGRFWRCCPDPWQYTGFTAFCGGARRYAARADGRADFFPFPCPGRALDASRFALALRGSAFLVQSRFFLRRSSHHNMFACLHAPVRFAAKGPRENPAGRDEKRHVNEGKKLCPA